MKVVFEADVFNKEENLKHIEDIILRIDDGAHEWHIEDPEIIEESSWYKESRKYVCELFETSCKRESWPLKNKLHIKCIHITDQSDGLAEFNLSETCRKIS